MSAVASFYVLRQEDLVDLRNLTKTMPKRRMQEGARVFSAKADEVTSSGSEYDAFWKFLEVRGATPKEYGWSGYVMDGILIYLKAKKIDLTKLVLDTGDDFFPWLIFDKKLKDKYLQKLRPAEFSIDELTNWFDDSFEHFPPEAIAEGFGLIYEYLSLVDESNVVILNTGGDLHAVISAPKTKPKKIKPVRIMHLCDACGEGYVEARYAKKIGVPSADDAQICGKESTTFTTVENGKQVQRTQDTTIRGEGLCEAPATGLYQYIF